MLPLIGFLPISYFHIPEWRLSLIQDLGISLGTMCTAQPWLSLEELAAFAVVMVWLGYCLSYGFQNKDRRSLIHKLVFLIVPVAVFAIVLRLQDRLMPELWRGADNLTSFGPFPNRNHFGTLAAIAAVLTFASAYDALKRKKFIWLVFALAVVPLFASVLLNTSRAGVLLFFVGIGGWMLTAAIRKRSLRQLAVSFSLLLIAAAVFLLYGRGILERFTADGKAVSTITTDGRLLIYKEAWELATLNPISGVGLGNFSATYPFVKSESDQWTRNRHPESDWLWFAAEAGVPALLVAAFGLIILIIHFWPRRGGRKSSRSDSRLRTAAMIGALLVAVHGLVDVPMHTLGLATLAALLAGMAMPPRDSANGKAYALWGHYIAALFCIGAGTLWLLIASGHASIPSGSSAKLEMREVEGLAQRGDVAGALMKVEDALKLRPLQWDYYYTRAVLKLRLGREPLDALNDFARTRALEPLMGRVCMDEAEVWLKFYPTYAPQAWREAMRRNTTYAQNYFQTALARSHAYPQIRSAVRELVDGDPKLHLLYLADLVGVPFQKELDLLLASQPTLQNYTKKERLLLFRLWYDRGDREKLISSLKSNADWRVDGWSLLATHYASLGDFRSAYQLGIDHLKPPFAATPSKGNIEQLQRNFLFNPTDIARGLELFEAQKAADLTEDALSTLKSLSELPSFPSKVVYEQAVMFARKGDFAKAWEKMQAYFALMENN
ncbi:MAG: O-antigen ligase family protein [Nitrospira sp.]